MEVRAAKPAISFADSFSLRPMILVHRRANDAAEEAQDDGIERPVSGKVGPDHQHEAQAGSAPPARSIGTGSTARSLRSTARTAGPGSRPGSGLLLLKRIDGLSDEGICERWAPVLPPAESSSSTPSRPIKTKMFFSRPLRSRIELRRRGERLPSQSQELPSQSQEQAEECSSQAEDATDFSSEDVLQERNYPSKANEGCPTL